MKIEQVAIEKLIPYEFNNKIHDLTQINRIANSIKEFWFTQPIVIDKDNIVIIGHWRLEAAKKLDLKEVPVVKMEDLSEAQVKKLRILDNKLNESERDTDNLKLEIWDLEDFNIWDIELSVEELFPDLSLNDSESTSTNTESHNIGDFSNKEITPEDLGDFDCKCPKCWFEFNLTDYANDI